MAIDVTWHNSVPDYDATDARHATAIFAGATTVANKDRSGVKQTNGLDMEVTVSGSTATIKAGRAFIEGSSSFQGGYIVRVTANENRSIGASHATLTRLDLVYLSVQDSDLGQGAGKVAVLGIAQGTPSGSPVEPTGLVPVNSIVLAKLEVPPSGGTILVTDRRPWLVAAGGVARFESGFQPDVPDGQLYYLRGTGKLIFNHAGGNQTVHDPSIGWVNLTPSAGYETAASQPPQILADGIWRHLRGRIQRTGAVNFLGNTTYTLDILSTDDRPPSGRVLYFPAICSIGNTQIVGRIEINGTDGGMRLLLPTANTSNVVALDSIRWTTI